MRHIDLTNLNRIIQESLASFLIKESMGVNHEMSKVAKLMAHDIANKYAFDTYLKYKDSDTMNYEEDEDGYSVTWDEDDDDWYSIEITDYVTYGNQDYEYFIFYDDNKTRYQKGYTDGELIAINFYLIKKILDKFWDDKMPSQKNWQDMVKNEIVNALYPIILHELTHTLDNESGTEGGLGTYVGCRFVEFEDVQECLYFFSQNEINARIGSVGALTMSLVNEYFFSSKDDVQQLLYSSKDFSEFVKDEILPNDELLLKPMDSYLWKMDDYGARYKKRPDILQYSKGNPYSFTYWLYKNDSRLKNNRNLKHLFETNFPAGEKAVYKFYKNLYDNYVNKIYKAVYGTMANFVGNG